MKILTLAFFFLTTQSFAASLCGAELDYVSTNNQYYDSQEQDMIFKVMKQDTWRVVKHVFDAVWQFEDHIGNEAYTGPDAGEIVYFSQGEKSIALVHFTRNGHEFGAYYEILGESYKKLATIDQNKTTCLK